MSTILRWLQWFVAYGATVIGGLMCFLVLAPLFGYAPYGDRPEPGWFGALPTLSWDTFWTHTRETLGFGLGAAELFALPAAFVATVMVVFERMCHKRAIVRMVGGAIGGVVAGYCMLGFAWYIAAGSAFVLIAVFLGTIAGAGFKIHRRSNIAHPH